MLEDWGYVRGGGREGDTWKPFVCIVKPLAGSLKKYCLNLGLETCISQLSRHGTRTPLSTGFNTKLSCGDHLGPERKKPLHQGSLAPCLLLEKRGQPRATCRRCRTRHSSYAQFLPRFYPRNTPTVQFLPRFYHLFTPYFTPQITLIQRVNPTFTPKLPPSLAFYSAKRFTPIFALYAPFLPQLYAKGKTGLFLLVGDSAIWNFWLCSVLLSRVADGNTICSITYFAQNNKSRSWEGKKKPKKE